MSVPRIKLSDGNSIPALGLGTWKSEPGQVAQAVKDAIAVGYRHIDCALIYANEKEVGQALKQVFSEGKVKREDLFITSKLWCTFHRPDLVEKSLKESLKDLGLEYLDLYLIHWPQAFKEDGVYLTGKDEAGNPAYSNVDYVDTWPAMESLVKKGLVKSIGLSNFNKKQIERILSVAKIQPTMLQIEIQPYFNQEKLINFARSKNMVVTAYSPLGSPDRPWAKPGEPMLIDEPKVKEVAKRHGKTSAQVLIRYAIDRGLVVIPKSVTKSRILENFQVFDFKLTEQDIKAIGSLECNGRLCSMGDVDHPHYPFHDEY